ncbi:MAG: FHA domain-containing protein [Actinomycetaceae bacterium]|nr:FHA domain-containing protein [Actinomycetaceae bacterium]
MSDLAFTTLRFGFVALLWLLVMGVVFVLMNDVYGTVVTPRGPGREVKDKRPGFFASRRHQSPATTTRAGAKTAVRIVVTQGPLVGSSLQLGSLPVVIGRSPACTLVLEDESSSREHARIYLDSGTWWVEDLNSTNGTLVQGRLIEGPTPLGLHMPITIGQSTLELREAP